MPGNKPGNNPGEYNFFNIYNFLIIIPKTVLSYFLILEMDMAPRKEASIVADSRKEC